MGIALEGLMLALYILVFFTAPLKGDAKAKFEECVCSETRRALKVKVLV